MVGLSINWYRRHRRSVEIGMVLGVDPVFLRAEGRNLLWRYLKQGLSTVRLLGAAKPAVVVVMQPPPLALLAALPHVVRRRPLLVGDLHSGVFFDPKWSWASRLVLSLLRRYGGAVVPNSELAARCRDAGVRTFVCHGLLTPVRRVPAARDRFVLVPLTYSRDEPVQAVLDAARATPQIAWVLTGRAPTSVVNAAPRNVTFSGFVSDAEYRELWLSATAIFALTTQPSTMQSAGYEAAASGTPLVTVAFDVLRDYFGDAALYVDNSAEQIAAAARTILMEPAVWEDRMLLRREQLLAEQSVVVEEIRAWVRSESRAL